MGYTQIRMNDIVTITIANEDQGCEPTFKFPKRNGSDLPYKQNIQMVLPHAWVKGVQYNGAECHIRFTYVGVNRTIWECDIPNEDGTFYVRIDPDRHTDCFSMYMWWGQKQAPNL